MSKIFLIFSLILLSCGPQPKTNAEVTVTYNGNLESYYHPDFNTEEDLKIALSDDKVPDFIIFSSPYCPACNDLKRLLVDLGWREHVIVLNMHEKWANFTAQYVGIRAVPSMIIDKDKGKTISQIFVGPADISRRLYLHFGDKK